MRTMTSVLMIVFFLSSCGKKPSGIDYSNRNQADSLTMDSIAADSSRFLIAELPVYFDSTDYLIHPIGLISLNESKAKRILKGASYSGSDYSDNEFSVDSYRTDCFSGNIMNLVFEDLKTHKQTLLTDKVLNITEVEYLRELSKKTEHHYILYSVIDNDMNKDSKLDYNDIHSLYISEIDGSNFKKITNNAHQYDGGKLIVQDLKYYFRTIEDTDKNGDLTKVDTYHYYYIDFTKDGYKVSEYYPLKLIMK